MAPSGTTPQDSTNAPEQPSRANPREDANPTRQGEGTQQNSQPSQTNSEGDTTQPADANPRNLAPTTPGRTNVAPRDSVAEPTNQSLSAPTSMNLEAMMRANTSFEMFNALLRVADQNGALSEKLATGSYTIFAPTGAAFAALPEGTIKQLVQLENRDLLMEIISYHILPGNVPANAVQSGAVKSLSGRPLTLEAGSGTVTANGIQVIQPDIQASNGTIHAVGQVILPSEIQARLNPMPVSATLK